MDDKWRSRRNRRGRQRVVMDRVLIPVSEIGRRDDDPAPRRPAGDAERKTCAAAVSDRTPSDVSRRPGPRHPGASPRRSRYPEPAACAVSPSAVVMGGPSPDVVPDPRPAVRRDGGPVAVEVRPPARSHCGIPDVSIRSLVTPRAVLIERAAVGGEVVGEIAARRRPKAGVAPRARPAIEGVEPRGIEGQRLTWRERITSQAALAGADNSRQSTVVSQQSSVNSR